MAADFDHVELNNPLSIKISKFLFILVSIFLVMHFGFKIIQYSQGVDQIAYRVLRRLFDLDGENTIPAWFSACLLWTSGVCLFAIGYLKPTLLSKYWYVLWPLCYFHQKNVSQDTNNIAVLYIKTEIFQGRIGQSL